MGCSGHSSEGNRRDDLKGTGCLKGGYHGCLEVGEIEELVAAFGNNPVDLASFVVYGKNKPTWLIPPLCGRFPHCAFRDQICGRFLPFTKKSLLIRGDPMGEIPKALREKVHKGLKLLVITGAGISAESGVPTFRGEDGLWKRYRAEDLATPWAFERDPKLVWEWYNWRREIIAKAEPNAGHRAIAEMEALFPNFFLITQNVDGLHRRAGNHKLMEIHGNLWLVRCTREGAVWENHEVPLKEIPPRCGRCGALLRPHVVWFGESLDPENLRLAYQLLKGCEVLLVVGTSGVVQPVASFPWEAKKHGAYVVEVNIEPTPITRISDLFLKGKASEILPVFLNELKDCLLSRSN